MNSYSYAGTLWRITKGGGFPAFPHRIEACSTILGRDYTLVSAQEIELVWREG